MATAVADRRLVREVIRAMPHLKRFALRHVWIDYDNTADVLYVSFERPQRATDSVLQDDNVLLRYRGKRLIGLTIIGTKAVRLKV